MAITINKSLTPVERARLENALAVAEKQAAIVEFNVLMGNIEDPSEEEGEFDE